MCKKGDKISSENIRSIRTSTGMSPKHYHSIIGKTANRDIPYGTPLSEKMQE